MLEISKRALNLKWALSSLLVLKNRKNLAPLMFRMGIIEIWSESWPPLEMITVLRKLKGQLFSEIEWWDIGRSRYISFTQPVSLEGPEYHKQLQACTHAQIISL